MNKINILKTICIAISFVVLCSCQKNDEIYTDNMLVGNWVNPVYDGEKTIYQRVNSLPTEDYGISFKENGNFIERSSGFCGTPPLIFSDYDGLWQLEDSRIKITAQSFLANYNWIVVSLTETELVLEREITEQEIEYRNLMSLFDEIYLLSTSISCTDSNDWSYTAYGHKACGGPQGYIAYSNQIDTVAFLNLISEYTEAERLYNIAWGIISSCDVPPEPTNVECQNGLPVLIY